LSIKLLAIDLDGTTLHKDTTLSIKVKKALKYILTKQVTVVPCTGRALCALPAEITAISGISYVITSNGAAIDHLPSGRRVYQHVLSKDVALCVLDAAACYDVMIEVIIQGKVYTEPHFLHNLSCYGTTPAYMSYVLKTREPVDDIYALTAQQDGGIENINLKMADVSLLEKLRQQLSKLGTVALTASYQTNIEVSALKTSKAQAVKWLCGQFGYSMEQVMAIGDSLNDVELLEQAGISVAMENGVPEVKRAADFITLANTEDGVAYAINHFYKEYGD